MVLPTILVKETLISVHDGPAGAHLGFMKTLRKIKARFLRLGLMREMHWYCNDCITCPTCKSRPHPRAPLQPIPSGNPKQRIHIGIVGLLPQSPRGNHYIPTIQCSFTKWAEAFAVPIQIHPVCYNLCKSTSEEQHLQMWGARQHAL